MAQKKAFVRYAANKAVPGSLIVRTKAPKVGTWKEVPYDVCCDGVGGNCCDNEKLITLSYTMSEASGFSGIVLSFYCDGNLITVNSIDKVTANIPETVVWLNLAYGSESSSFTPLVGTFSSSGNTFILTMTECQKKALCPTGELTFQIVSYP